MLHKVMNRTNYYILEVAIIEVETNPPEDPHCSGCSLTIR